MSRHRFLAHSLVFTSLIAFVRPAFAVDAETLGPQLGQGENARPRPTEALGDGEWRPLGVGGHTGHVALYDSRHDEMVVYGGDGGYNDVWALSLSGRPTWRLVAPSSHRYGPDGIDGVSAILDPVHERLLAFGGHSLVPDDYNAYFNDVSALPLSGGPGWSGIATSGGPPCARSGALVLYDPVGDRMVVLGGWWDTDHCDGNFKDVWALSLGEHPTWSQLLPSGTPPASIAGYTATYDPVRHRIVVFAGWEVANRPATNGVWVLSLSENPSWSQLATTGVPPDGRWGHTSIYDPVGDRLVMFGGVTSKGAVNDVWALSLSGIPTWTQLTPSGTPPSGRSGHAAIYDPLRRRMIVHGGGSGQQPAKLEVWALSLSKQPRWSLLAPSGTLDPPPDGNVYAPAVYDPVADEIAFLNRNLGAPLDRLTTLSLSGSPRWDEILLPGPAPTGRYGTSLVYDTEGRRIVMFGGSIDGVLTPTNDVWALSLQRDPRWSRLLPAGELPTARNNHSAIFDPVRRQMIVFGGQRYDPRHAAEGLNDVWTLSLSGAGTWSELHPLGTPPAASWGHSAYYDAAGDRMIVYAANPVNFPPRRDVWALSLSGTPTWSRLSPSGEVPSNWGLPAIYDPERDRLVVVNATGYCEDNGQFPTPQCEGVWALGLSSAAWTKLSPTGAAPSSLSQMAIYDPERDQMILVAQQYHTDPRYKRCDLRALVWGATRKGHGRNLETVAPAPESAASGSIGTWELSAPRPDPTAGSTLIEFTVPQAAELTLSLFDLAGRQVALLAQGWHAPGRHQVSWNGRSGVSALPPGVYHVRLATPAAIFTRTLVLIH